ncbi:WXG100 family type VII secretion target [Streptomyces sp. NBC_00102]|uniref:WXG100 family type VII secretion target n=1 Tax=Streptomyces sp. NBC_00102 TaxID=2975652 RepID=UPI0022551C5D|nr:WXG100 family type VII secretion target [Streptomyces sp. NBC_00102]MCX5400142.1 WXG100 family type VII secretion target [Streptomyces sp. NBC_00102]
MSNNDGTTVVTYSSLEAAASAVERQSKQLDEDLAAIKRRVASVAELWQGEAKGAYDTAQAGWDKDARAIHESLVSITRAVREAASAYQAGDKKASQNF